MEHERASAQVGDPHMWGKGLGKSVPYTAFKEGEPLGVIEQSAKTSSVAVEQAA